MATKEPFPIQPLITDDSGVRRFRKNAIVDALLATSKLDLNDIARLPFEREDREQFKQLIGYSLSGYAELSEVSDETYARVQAKEKETFG